ncbi:hypothetical protein NDU88_006983 [Pleurodeles waltl]|uniref:Uncharacterized protein n=1 Tax=Pleurodeles waltl TaxID=8319 RepID=A0AAV7QKE1_PLEWA|nr:hypothetical protein NDU88_006982 [Pleurodeles waltl]KAJ1140634.1 hypothetical protein NDU88_006983 [Pleurodeles waltl]
MERPRVPGHPTTTPALQIMHGEDRRLILGLRSRRGRENRAQPEKRAAVARDRQQSPRPPLRPEQEMPRKPAA